MKTIHQWLRKQKATEIMTKSVACLRPSDRLADAVNLFLRDQISGAPVVDKNGVCVGVLSATDIVSFEEKRANTHDEPPSAKRPCFDTWNAGAQWWLDVQRVREELQPRLEESVIGYMTRDIVSVTEDTPLGVIIQQMIDAHVHRVLVLDSHRRLLGIVTTMDVLAAALRAGRRELAVSLVGGTDHEPDQSQRHLGNHSRGSRARRRAARHPEDA
jgi:CBS domain-containing protein